MLRRRLVLRNTVGTRWPSSSTRTRSFGRSGGDRLAEMPNSPVLLCTMSCSAGRVITRRRYVGAADGAGGAAGLTAGGLTTFCGCTSTGTAPAEGLSENTGPALSFDS